MNYTATTNRFVGLDERRVFSEDVSVSPYMRNYKVTENGTLQKRHGLTALVTAEDPITGFWSGFLGGERFLLFVSGGILYKVEKETNLPVELGEVGEGENTLFRFGELLYIKNANRFSRFDGERVTEVEGYVPLIAMGCAPAGGGDTFEDVNLLSSRRRVRFSCDGTSTVYQLPEKNLAAILAVSLDGEEYGEEPLVDTVSGTVAFPAPPPSGINNLEVLYDTGEDRREVILGATGVMLFGGDTDGHVFLWGNEDFPAYRFHSELAGGIPSAEYFPENNYTVIGGSKIMDIISQYDRQLIFTRDRAYYSYCQLQTDTLGNVYASFPVYNLNGEKGSMLENMGCMMDNQPVTLCADGLNRWESTSVENEKNAVCFSGPIGETVRRLLSQGSTTGMKLFNLRCHRELFFVAGDEAFVYHYPTGAWYAYDNFRADFLAEHEGNLYLVRDNTILFLDPTSSYDEEGVVKAVWESPYTSLGISGAKKRLTEVNLGIKTAGTPVLDISCRTSGGEQTETRLSPACHWESVMHLSFRPALPPDALTKIRITQQDYTQSELLSLGFAFGRKGRYGRQGI